ncbi:MAG: efflux RND transporter periplasmic adaptor subunit [Spirochaetaceae bacterium]|jgi:HlyD family secretion protein|nr:efflux RND transporter periplasmic adaptor subunit [Spirochaetaceae bacterium]
MKKLYTILVVLIFILLTSCGINDQEIYASGTFEATEIILSAKANGEIIQFDLTEGERVEAGQVLGTIDSTILELTKDQLLSTIRSTEARRPNMAVQRAPLLSQLESTKSEQQRIERLFNLGAATEKDLDDMNALVSSLEKQLSALDSTLQKTNDGISEDLHSLDIQIRQMDEQINNCSIVAPLSGSVLALYAEQGEYALPGKSLVKIADLHQMYLRAYITSAQLTEMQLGQSVRVIADFGDKETRSYDGTLSWISDQGEFTPKTIQTREERSNLVYAVKVDVQNDGYLKIGMYGGIQISDE